MCSSSPGDLLDPGADIPGEGEGGTWPSLPFFLPLSPAKSRQFPGSPRVQEPCPENEGVWVFWKVMVSQTYFQEKEVPEPPVTQGNGAAEKVGRPHRALSDSLSSRTW